MQHLANHACNRARFVIIILATFLALSPLMLSTAEFALAISVVSTIKVGNMPTEIRFNPVNRSMYVLNTQGEFVNGNISVIDARTNQFLTNITIPNPENIAFNPNNNQMYVTNFTNVVMINATDNKIIKTIRMFVNGTIPNIVVPNAIAYNPKNGNMYLPANVMVTSIIVNNTRVNIPPGGVRNTCARSMIITCVASIIDSKSNKIVGNVPIGKQGDLRASTGGIIAFNPRNSNMYIGNYRDKSISIVNSANKVWVPILLSGSPTAIAYNPKDGNMYVADSSSVVSVIDWKTNNVKHISGIGIVPNAIAYNPKDGNMYVAGGGSKSVYVIDHQRYNFTTVPLGGSHDATTNAIAYNPKNGNIYVLIGFDNIVKVVNSAPGRYKVVDTIPVRQGAFKIALDPINNNMYVSNSLNNTVSVIG